MDSINDIISSLSNDDIEMLKGVANSILNNDSNQNSNNNNNNNNQQSISQSLTSLMGNNSNQNPMSNLNANDLNMILKARAIFEKMNNKSSKNADLIMALKPHLSEKYRDRADQAMRMLQLFEALPYIKELF